MTNTEKLAKALVEKGATKKEVMTLIVNTLKAMGLNAEQQKAIGWEVYKSLCAAA